MTAESGVRRWATKAEVAEHLRTSIRTVERMVDRGELRAYPVGERLVRFDLAEVDAALTTGQETTA